MEDVASHGGPPATGRQGAPALREHLPGLEPERRVDDWGRSELVEDALDRGLLDFLYHVWFRVEVSGVDHVPRIGPALLVANRAGALRADAAVIGKAVRERTGHPRRVRFATERALGAVPGRDMLIAKAGGVSAHPANLHRLLFDEGELILAFPEGGPAAPLRDRYRVRPFSRADLLGAALRARVPIVPVAVLGTEEASPVIARLPRPLGTAVTVPLALPAKIRIRFLAPIAPDRADRQDRADRPDRGDQADRTGRVPGADPVEALAAEVRAAIQDALLELVAARRSVWLG